MRTLFIGAAACVAFASTVAWGGYPHPVTENIVESVDTWRDPAVVDRSAGGMLVTKAINAAKRGRYGEAVELLHEAAATGNARAMTLLGEAYAHGAGVQQSAGDARAMLSLGVANAYGRGTVVDREAAGRWLRLAREDRGSYRAANALILKLRL